MYGATTPFWALASPKRRFYSSPPSFSSPFLLPLSFRISNAYKIAVVTAVFYLAEENGFVSAFSKFIFRFQ
jgi:hypothetical protein